MVNYVATLALNLVCLFAGFWRSFKLLKAGTVDFTILEFWAVLGVVRLLENTLEWLVSWVPFYWTTKSLALLTLCFPESRLPGILFDTLVIPFMRFCHEVLSEDHIEEKLFERLMVLPFVLLDLVIPGLASARSGKSVGAASGGYEAGDFSPRRRASDLEDVMEMDISVRGSDLAADAKDAGHAGDAPKTHRRNAAAKHMDSAEDFTSCDVSRMVSTHNRLQLIARHHISPQQAKGKERTGEEDKGGPSVSTADLDDEIALEKASSPSDGRSGTAGLGARTSLRRRHRNKGLRSASKSPEKEEDGGRDAGKTEEDSSSRRRRLWRSSFYGSKSDDAEGGDTEKRGLARKMSLGKSMRELLTGDQRVRIRDHLFDLSTTTPPPRTAFGSSSGGRGNDSPGRKRSRRRRAATTPATHEWK